MNFLGQGFQKLRALQTDPQTLADRCDQTLYHAALGSSGNMRNIITSSKSDSRTCHLISAGV